MKVFVKGAITGALVLAVTACSQDTTGITPVNGAASLDGAFNTALFGSDNIHSSFDGGDSLDVWGPDHHGRGPGGRDDRSGHDGFGDDHGRGPGGPGFRGRGHEGEPGGPEHGMGGLMGGGLGGPFIGDGFGPGFGHGRFGDNGFSSSNCTFDAATGRVVCAPVTHDGLTINRSAAYATLDGTAQQAFDSLTTNSFNVRVSVTGSKMRRDSSVTTVQLTSDRTVVGLAPGSTQRVVSGTSAGTETTTGSDSTGAFTATRVAGDTITAVVIPVPSSTGARPYPTSGSVIRSMSATVTYADGTSASSTRREVLTYDGTATATLVITRNGVTQNCTIALPHGRPSCQ